MKKELYSLLSLILILVAVPFLLINKVNINKCTAIYIGDPSINSQIVVTQNHNYLQNTDECKKFIIYPQNPEILYVKYACPLSDSHLRNVMTFKYIEKIYDERLGLYDYIKHHNNDSVIYKKKYNNNIEIRVLKYISEKCEKNNFYTYIFLYITLSFILIGAHVWFINFKK